jgi:thioredoxin reductase/SAM-dependent methyltransferase
VHNYLGREGTPPAELLAAGRAELAGYGGRVVTGTVSGAGRTEDGGFAVTLADGRATRARRLLVTTGLTDELPDVPGVAERWGRDVLHCPYCHGWEVRGRAVGVLATGPLAVHQALMWRQWTDDVTFFAHTGPPAGEAAEQLAARGITVVPGPVAGLQVTGDTITGVRLASGRVVELDAVVVQTRLTARGDLLAGLGLKPQDMEMNGHVIGSFVPADPTGATEVPGVWVAGNVTDLRAGVIGAATAGQNAAAALNADLIAEDTRLAVVRYRELLASFFEESAWEERYRSKPAVWSGRPNPQLVAEAADLPAGSALDVGSGEGADALWLAARGWRVTAVDFSTVALQRAAGHAAAAGADVDWVHADLRRWTPPVGAFDLVSAQFMHLPGDDRRALFARLADAVAPGGTLLVVGHHPSDLRTSAHRVNLPDFMYTADEVADSLDPARWEIVAAEARPRAAAGHDGEHVTVHDAVLRARRR